MAVFNCKKISKEIKMPGICVSLPYKTSDNGELVEYLKARESERVPSGDEVEF